VKCTVKAVRTEEAKGAITLKLDGAPKGITLKRAVIPADQNEIEVSLTISRQIRAGSRVNVVLVGSMKAGKETFTSIVPAIPVSVVAATAKKE